MDRTVPQFIDKEIEEPGIKTNDENLEQTLVPESTPEQVQESEWKTKVISQINEISEYFTGFMIGLLFSLLGYSIISKIHETRKKKKGLFIGCITSFACIITICIFFMCYTRTELISQRNWRHHHKSLKHYKGEAFMSYMGTHLSSMAMSLQKNMTIFQMTKNHLMTLKEKRRSRQKMRTKRSIQAMEKMNRKIRYHLRRLI